MGRLNTRLPKGYDILLFPQLRLLYTSSKIIGVLVRSRRDFTATNEILVQTDRRNGSPVPWLTVSS